MSFRIIGTGGCVPEKIITNAQIASIVDTSDEWIKSRSGISERRVCADESLCDLAEISAVSALSDARTSPDELDMIICATVNGDSITPSLSSEIQQRIGGKAVCFDINAACSGFVYALDIADAFFQSGRAENILVVCAEALSRITDWSDRSTCVLFGDGAGAAVLRKGDGFFSSLLTTSGCREVLYADAPCGNTPFDRRGARNSAIVMNGPEIYKFAVTAVEQNIKTLLERESIPEDDIAAYFLHQANKRIIDAVISRLGQPASKFPQNIHKYGNTSSACIPLMLDEMNKNGKLENGSRILLSAFGAGLTTGSCIIKWNK